MFLALVGEQPRPTRTPKNLLAGGTESVHTDSQRTQGLEIPMAVSEASCARTGRHSVTGLNQAEATSPLSMWARRVWPTIPVAHGHLTGTSFDSLSPCTRMPLRLCGGSSHLSLAATAVIT